ncbi:MAG: hypothetical protein MUE31_00860 [Candidatus Nanopelagicales bacterium]|nr:hypothetical protein [Candidatus Nanopelagicales bacterium]
MADSPDPDRGIMHIRTNRLGLVSIQASAPVVDGRIWDAGLEFTVRIDRVSTGNPLLDPELHALIHQLTSGTLTFSGTRDGDTFTGTASAGDITIPLDLVSSSGPDGALAVTGASRFSDVHVPLPALGHIHHLEVDIYGHLRLA